MKSYFASFLTWSNNNNALNFAPPPPAHPIDPRASQLPPRLLLLNLTRMLVALIDL